ncbi:cyclase family protein [Solirubrobacter deserti]|uniref:Cyclase family protein n=1 Tax=Solirubrobacter deserti TaxID=2282478 RepID=A0ABT4RCR4_9ACTN|nr:cyclase family protein [Solirubrobacter deserti]MDA0136324.1 cyclase family protein [Solirubrobacter deserti]
MTRRSILAAGVAGGTGLALKGRGAQAQAAGTPAAVLGGALAGGAWEVIDLSVTTGEEHPVAFPDQPQFKVVPLTWFKRRTAVKPGIAAVNAYEITEHTGTQVDFPPHFIPPPGTNVPGSPGRAIGERSGDEYPLTSLMGPAVVLDVRAILAAHTAKGRSAKITPAWIERWEARFGTIARGEVPVLFSGYTDRYYRRFPGGDRFKDRLLWKPLIDKSEPGWVVLAPDAVELLWSRGVQHVATDAPSFGAAEDPQDSHVAGLKHGMTWTEQAIRLGRLPRRGAFYVCAPYKVADQQAGVVRAFAFSPRGAAATETEPPLAL